MRGARPGGHPLRRPEYGGSGTRPGERHGRLQNRGRDEPHVRQGIRTVPRGGSGCAPGIRPEVSQRHCIRNALCDEFHQGNGRRILRRPLRRTAGILRQRPGGEGHTHPRRCGDVRTVPDRSRRGVSRRRTLHRGRHGGSGPERLRTRAERKSAARHPQRHRPLPDHGDRSALPHAEKQRAGLRAAGILPGGRRHRG